MNESEKSTTACPIAIIGMACLFPQAPNLRAFWENIIRGVDAISDPIESWDAKRYLDSGRITTCSGGYLRDLYRFDPREFGIMPSSLDGGEPDQFLALLVTRDALLDAGYLNDQADHRDTGIVLGHSTYLHRGQGTLIQNHIVIDQTLEILRVAYPSLDETTEEKIRGILKSSLPASTPDIAPSLVPNVMTGRIANRLNLKGPNYLIDAACSSSLLAVGAAADELRAGRSKMMIAGGVNASLPAEVSVIFSQLGALSARGKVRPFEEGSDGTLLGEGLGAVVLKRLDDAVADGDRIYAVLREVGQASDGRGQGLLAPSVEGETLAIRRAYDQSGIDPKTIGLVEAHGTGIPLGDRTEIASLKNVFGTSEDTPHVALGSVKSMISHCIPAAGIAGLIKASLAVHHRLLPPTLCERVNGELQLQSPFYVNAAPSPWIQPPKKSRRAGVNSFGFGGINTHAIIEQAPSEARRPADLTPWSHELCIFSAATKEKLRTELEELAARLELDHDWSLAEIAQSLSERGNAGPHRLSLVASDLDNLKKSLSQAAKRLEKPGDRFVTRTGLSYCAAPQEGKLAFLFPGEGSQYPHMLSELSLHFSEVRTWFDFWADLYGEEPGQRRTDIAFPPRAPGQGEDALGSRLHDMDVGSEAVFVGGQAMYSLLRSLGVMPDVLLGHSSGESSALAASGAFPADSREQLGETIRILNSVYKQILSDGKIPTGALLAVGAMKREELQRHIDECPAEVAVAMDNCQSQLILYTSREGAESLQPVLTKAGAVCIELPFDRGYHTQAFQSASEAFLEFYRSVGLTTPTLPLYSCATADVFPSAPAEVQDLAALQWSSCVRFRETIEQLYADGVRTFIEVGPSGNLTAFVQEILTGKEGVAIATNLRKKSDLAQLLTVLGQLHAEGRPVAWENLYGSRELRSIHLEAPQKAAARGFLLDNTMPRVQLSPSKREELASLFARSVEPAAPIHEAPIHEALTRPAPSCAASSERMGVETASAETSSELAGSYPVGDAIAPESQVPQVTDPVMAAHFDLMQGFLAQQGALFERLTSGVAQSTSAPDFSESFVHEIVERSESHLLARVSLDLLTDNFLQDHVLSGPVSDVDPSLFGLSCVPLMVSLEILAEGAAELWGGAALRMIEDVRAFGWIALDDEQIELWTRIDRTEEPGVFFAQLLRDETLLVSARFRFDAGEMASTSAPAAPLNEHRPSVWNGEQLYTSGMFHGPLFQSIQHIDGWNDSGIDAQLASLSLDHFFQDGHRPPMVLNPVLLDSMGQLAAYWFAQKIGTGFNCFPSTIERIELLGPFDQEGLRLFARQTGLPAGSPNVSVPHSWSFECVDSEGAPLVRVQGLTNVFFEVPHRFYEVRKDPRHGNLGEPVPTGSSDLFEWQLDHLPLEFCTQSSGVFLRILSRIYLNRSERTEWEALAGPKAVKAHALQERICLKEAVRGWILQQTGHRLLFADIAISLDPSGHASVSGAWADDLIAPPRLTFIRGDAATRAFVSPAAEQSEFQSLIDNPVPSRPTWDGMSLA